VRADVAGRGIEDFNIVGVAFGVAALAVDEVRNSLHFMLLLTSQSIGWRFGAVRVVP
jgi:hypothetical protein